MKRILFSCVGSTDPVRGLRDGSMLHIMRHYRPDKVVLYLSAEIRERMQKTIGFSGHLTISNSVCRIIGRKSSA